MKIIKLGKIKDAPVKKKCSDCETEFEYERSDIQHDRDGSYVVCPNKKCAQFIFVESN